MISSNFHTHTVYCDGNNTPMEMAEAAVRAGLTALGFSGHAYLAVDDAAMNREGTEEYVKAVLDVREQMKGKLRVYLGEELDYFSPKPWFPLDYAIGSVHFLQRSGESVDWTKERLLHTAEKLYDGDFYALAEDYYALVADVLEKTGADIIGHFDLISKYNEEGYLFHEEDPRYMIAWQRAADRLLKYKKPFEINTGAMAKGYKSQPYPSEDILLYLRDRGATFVYSSDAHSVETIAYGREQVQELSDRLGLNLVDFEQIILAKRKMRL